MDGFVDKHESLFFLPCHEIGHLERHVITIQITKSRVEALGKLNKEDLYDF